MLDPLPPLAVRKSSASSPSNMMETSIDEGIETEELDTEDTHVFNAYQMARFGQRRHTLSEVTNQPGVITSGGGCGLRLIIHWATFWAMLQGNFVKSFCQHATRWDTGSVTNLKYPDRNVLPILNGIVPKQHCSKKVAPSIISLKARTHRDEFRARYSPTFNASWLNKGRQCECAHRHEKRHA